MPAITTDDGVEIFYKDWGQVHPSFSVMVGRSPLTTGIRR